MTPEKVNKVAELLENAGVDPDDIGTIDKVRVGSYQMLTKERQEDGTDETKIHDLEVANVVYTPRREATELDFVRQAPPTIIRPSKRRTAVRDGECTVFLGDIHFPFHNEHAVEMAHLAIRALAPDGVVCLGDNQDQAMLSKFERRKEWQGSTQLGLDLEHDFLSRIRANIGEAGKLIRHSSNHDIRLEREIRNFNGELLGLRRANAQEELGVLTMGFLLRLGELNVITVEGYPNAEYWHESHLKSFHGRVTNPKSKAAHMAVSEETTSVVFGHDHGAGIAWRTIPTQDGQRRIFALNAGTLALTDGTAPSGRYSTTERGVVVPRAHNWQNMVAVVYHNPETAAPYLLPITEDGIDIHGRTYKS